MGHGFTQRNMQKVENERDDIRKTADAIAKAPPASAPRGWLGPGLTETWETPGPPAARKATTTSPTGCSTTSRSG